MAGNYHERSCSEKEIRVSAMRHPRRLAQSIALVETRVGQVEGFPMQAEEPQPQHQRRPESPPGTWQDGALPPFRLAKEGRLTARERSRRRRQRLQHLLQQQAPPRAE